jgi:broad specificity phosphatase PhoE
MSSSPILDASHRPRLVLVRHGQASLGTHDYDRLSELGQRQAGQAGQRLASLLSGPVALWSGTHRRHHQTVVSMAPHLQARVASGLDEFSTFSLVRAAVLQAERLGLHRPDDRLLADPRTHLPQLLEWFPEVLGAWQEGRLAADDIDPWPVFRQRVLTPVADWRAGNQGRSIGCGGQFGRGDQYPGRGIDRERAGVPATAGGSHVQCFCQ